MSPKTTIGLLACLLLALGGVWWAMSTPAAPKSTEKREAKDLLDPPLGDITGFEVKVESQPTIVFAKQDGEWWVTSPFKAPAEDGVVKNEVDKLAKIKYERTFSKSDAEAPDGKMTSLDSPLRIAKLTDDAGRSAVLKIGKRRALSKETYVKKEGDETIYLATTDVSDQMKKRLDEYRGRLVAKFKTADAARIEVSGENHYTLVKTGGTWTLEEPVRGRVDAAKVTSILNGISNLRVDDWVDENPASLRQYGLEQPHLLVTVTTEKRVPKPAATTAPATQPAEPEEEIVKETTAVAFGGVAQDKVFAKMAGDAQPAVFQIGKYTLDQIDVPLADIRDKAVTTVNTAAATKLAVTSGENRVDLEKQGDEWSIASASTQVPLAGQAEFAAVNDLLNAIKDLKATGFENADVGAFGFSTPRAAIEITSVGQLAPVRLVVGGLTSTQTGAYVQNATEGLVAVVPSAEAEKLIVDPLNFLSRELTQIDKEKVTRIDQVRGGLSCTVSKKDDAWKFTVPIEGDADKDVIDAILTDLSGLRGRKVVAMGGAAAEYGLDKPAVKLTVSVTSENVAATSTQPESAQGLDTKTHTLLLHQSADGNSYAMVEGGATICEVDAKVFDDARAELLSQKLWEAESYKTTLVRYLAPAQFEFDKEGNLWKHTLEPSFQTDPTKIDELINAVRDLKIAHFVQYQGDPDGEAFGLKTPSIVIVLAGEKGAAVTLSISDRGPEGGVDRYAMVSTSPGRVFVLKFEDVLKLNKTVVDFQKSE